MTDRLIAELGKLGRQRSGEETPAHDASRREALVQALHRDPPQPLWQRPGLWMAAATVVVIALLLTRAWPTAATLGYAVSGATAEDGYVQAVDDVATIAFSDGSSFAVAHESAARVVDVDRDGARVLLERGHLDATVVPRTGARWRVAAGPFAIAVTGTRFGVTWEAEHHRFEVTLLEGSVTVRGPMLERGLAMHAGQRLVARVDANDVQLTDIAAAAPDASDSSAVAPPPASVGVAPSASSAAPDASATTPAPADVAPPSWSKLIASGRYAEVMSLARGMGIGAVLSGGSLEQLVALGDAARYTGDGGLSQQVLVSLRERYPASPSARTAAFLLGRMAEGGSASAALGWYDRYLAESPGGAYASEALGRKMVILSRQRPAEARAIARQYLKAYPRGGYANVARTLITP